MSLQPADLYSWRRRILWRVLLLAVIAGFIALGWWLIPWTIYAAFAFPALVLYTLIWRQQRGWRRWLGWLHVAVDLMMLALLVRYTGGGVSPFDNLAYIWFFGMVQLYMRRAQTARLPLFSVLAFIALAAGTWGFPNWPAYLGFHTLGLGLAALLGMTLLEERSRNLIDPLTKVFHRRAGLERLGSKIERGVPFTLTFIDLRAFKAVNDTYGHAVGDEVVCAVAKRILGELRQGDLALRYGGDEFVMASDAPALGARLEQVFSSPVRTSAGSINVSADVGEVSWSSKESIETLLSRADEAMYGRKREAYAKGRSAS